MSKKPRWPLLLPIPIFMGGAVWAASLGLYGLMGVFLAACLVLAALDGLILFWSICKEQRQFERHFRETQERIHRGARQTSGRILPLLLVAVALPALLLTAVPAGADGVRRGCYATYSYAAPTYYAPSYTYAPTYHQPTRWWPAGYYRTTYGAYVWYPAGYYPDYGFSYTRAVPVAQNLDYYFSVSNYYRDALLADAVAYRLLSGKGQAAAPQQPAAQQVQQDVQAAPPKPAQGAASSGVKVELSPKLRTLVQSSCIKCHQGASAKQGFRLDSPEQLTSAEWWHALGRAAASEMPPGKALPNEDVNLMFEHAKKVRQAELQLAGK